MSNVASLHLISFVPCPSDYANEPRYFDLFTLAPGGVCEGNAFGSICLYVCLYVHASNSKTISPIDLIFYTKRSILMALPSTKINRIRIHNWAQDFIKGFFTIAIYTVGPYMATKYAMMYECVMMKKCVMTSKGHHSQRDSAISDCLV